MTILQLRLDKKWGVTNILLPVSVVRPQTGNKEILFKIKAASARLSAGTCTRSSGHALFRQIVQIE